MKSVGSRDGSLLVRAPRQEKVLSCSGSRLRSLKNDIISKNTVIGDEQINYSNTDESI